MVEVNKIDDFTVDLVILEILDVTGIGQLKTEEVEKFKNDIKTQLNIAIVSDLLNNLSVDDQKDLIEGLKKQSPEKVIEIFFSRIKNAQQIASNSVKNFKDKFIKDYFSRLQNV